MNEPFSVAIGCDEAGFELKELLKRHIEDLGYRLKDFGCYSTDPVLYPDIATAVATAISAGQHRLGVLICGTGIGMAISANKIQGIRAAQAHDTYSAERARKSNDAQIVSIGARVIGPELAKNIVKSFLESEFEAGRSGPKVERIKAVEKADREQSPK
ncbi:Ribose 5-phosphate isomerase B protein [Azotobacter vinelandii CA]|uniref:Ribose 5-phosphate isomerase B protein n=2 Tax=Azotobacter vinelandii TaxID=354 RepID=C1DG92_AZOVD|nr:ribose 5-phosphate isomerase B [Azotobacter vinelandii]ACO78403.1 Ribose 5-phosphate isomerase B protein [Azotobacter vinelandii DJ]AGK13962.1 Ribose 5-phosphate isomerase B protein [Azotobacter vinelandii CA]AGK18706.1 Ribose 5-phosphate isomerase B protein [Azotobacter vinelandii CA6]WKN24108.1 ribose 5-phosphate isomerase B [Azotobacter vinelandii]SFY29127.1 ribose-5-phosphate isomerase [Azotobacter vinelandii]